MKKDNFILDLDQTVISAEAEEEYDFNAHKQKAKKFKYKDMDGYYIVFERPGLQKFLTYLFKNFNVSIWTAATKDYALFIIEHMILQNKPSRKLDYIFFSYHCKLSKKSKKASKNLQMLWDIYKLPNYNPFNTLILDDYDEVQNTQPMNCIPAEPFEFTDEGSEKDDFLKRLVPAIEKIQAEKAIGNKPLKPYVDNKT